MTTTIGAELRLVDDPSACSRWCRPARSGCDDCQWDSYTPELVREDLVRHLRASGHHSGTYLCEHGHVRTIVT